MLFNIHLCGVDKYHNSRGRDLPTRKQGFGHQDNYSKQKKNHSFILHYRYYWYKNFKIQLGLWLERSLFGSTLCQKIMKKWGKKNIYTQIMKVTSRMIGLRIGRGKFQKVRIK